MRFVKLAVISVVVIFIILSVMGALLPSEILVSRAVDIRGNRAGIRQQVFNLGNWQHWMTAASGEKTPQRFDSANGQLSIGAASIRVTDRSDSTLTTAWRTPAEMKGSFRLIDHRTPDSLYTLQWQMEQDISWFFWEKFAAITRDEIWGGSMEKSLENLKTIVEQQ